MPVRGEPVLAAGSSIELTCTDYLGPTEGLIAYLKRLLEQQILKLEDLPGPGSDVKGMAKSFVL